MIDSDYHFGSSGGTVEDSGGGGGGGPGTSRPARIHRSGRDSPPRPHRRGSRSRVRALDGARRSRRRSGRPHEYRSAGGVACVRRSTPGTAPRTSAPRASRTRSRPAGGWPASADSACSSDHIYADQAQSGARRDRQGLSALVAAAQSGQFDVVLVDDLSRLARDNYLMLSRLAELRFEGVRVVSVADGLDSEDEEATLGIQIRGIFNELQLRDLREEDAPRADGPEGARLLGRRADLRLQVRAGRRRSAWTRRGARVPRATGWRSSLARRRSSCGSSRRTPTGSR